MRSWTADIDDIDRLAAVQPEASVEHVRTSPGAFRLRMAVADFGAVRMQSAAVSNSYLVRGALHADRHTFLMPATRGGGSRLNGIVVDDADAILLRAGSDIHSHVAAGQRWMGVALRPDVFGETLAPLGLEAAGRVICRGLLTAAPGLRLLVAEVAGLALAEPHRLEGAAVAAAIVEETRLLLEAGLGASAPEPIEKADRRHLRMYRGAVDFLDTVLDRPVYSAAVSAALDADERTVNAAFRAVCGMTLHRYLLLRRLDLARRRLAGAADARRVKTVALDLGFWHLGRFARDYRALYGESPSDTLARRQGAVLAAE